MAWRQILEQDAFLKEWLNRRPVNTRRHWAPYARRMLDDIGLSGREFTQLLPKEAVQVAWEHISKHLDKPEAAKVIMCLTSNMYRWATGGERLWFDNRRGGAHHIPSIVNGDRHTPTKGEVYRIADCAGNFRGKAIVLVLFHSGIRPNALCSLNYGHVAEQLNEHRVPLRLKITSNIDSKMQSYRLGYYYTWLQGEAVQALQNHVRHHNGGWRLSDPLFHSVQSRRYTYDDVYKIVRNYIYKAGLDTKQTCCYDLRKAFYKVLMNTRMNDPNFKEALMGHKLSGSRGNYFDHHDLGALEREYMKANFGRHTPRSEVTLLREELEFWNRKEFKVAFLELMRERGVI